MKILHISTSDLNGGAARACYHISTALVSIGIDSKILVQKKLSSNDLVIKTDSGNFSQIRIKIRVLIDYLLIQNLSVHSRGRFTFSYIGANLDKHPLIEQADVINLHWINEGFFSLETLKQILTSGKPVIWTMHDMWAFTGGCHYSLECRKFETECSVCPSLKLRGENDFSHKIFNKKFEIFKSLNIHVVTCSKWLASEAKKSKLFKDKDISIIPNTLNTDTYKPLDKAAVLKRLGLNADNKYILFGTMTLKDKRKGFDLFIDAIQQLSDSQPDLRKKLKLLVAGSEKNLKGVKLPLETIFLGRLNGESEMADFYNAGSLFVAPSREDNLPNTVMESLSCGTPVIAFNIGGMPDMIEHKINGYLAEPFNVNDLMRGILWVLTHSEAAKISDAARMLVLEKFNAQLVADTYLKLYKSVLKREY